MRKYITIARYLDTVNNKIYKTFIHHDNPTDCFMIWDSINAEHNYTMKRIEFNTYTKEKYLEVVTAEKLEKGLV